MAPLRMAALGGPVDKSFHMRPVFPGKMEKFSGIHSGSFLA
jgi:hypothetical protein